MAVEAVTGGHAVRDLLCGATTQLQGVGIPDPGADARLLIQHALGWDRARLYARLDQRVTASELRQFQALLQRRRRREPLPHLLGEWEFWGLMFHVTAATLIPRPETETLVEAAVRSVPHGTHVLEVGTGSGCVAVALASERPDLRITALELDPQAAAVGQVNVTRHGLGDRIRVSIGEFPHHLGEDAPLGALISNPPYIPTGELEALQPEVRDFEPRIALDGGRDGLRLHRQLIERGAALVVPGGLLAMEMMPGQADAIRELLPACGWEWLADHPDMTGRPRVTSAARSGKTPQPIRSPEFV